jgi:hypothetical protein
VEAACGVRVTRPNLMGLLLKRGWGWGSGMGGRVVLSLHTGTFNHESDPRSYLTRTS